MSAAPGTLGRMLSVPDLLDFEAAWPHHNAGKNDAIERTLGVRPARYYQLLHRAARSVEGQAYDALTAHRVTRRLNAA